MKVTGTPPHRRVRREQRHRPGTPRPQNTRGGPNATHHLLDQLADPTRHEGDRVVVTGPTWLLGTEIVLATIAAVDLFHSSVHHFVDEVDSDPRLLREALSAANAWCETLMGYEHVETFGAEG